MDYINKLFTENSDLLTRNLSTAGFSVGETERFLPVVSSSISSLFHQSGMEKIMSGISTGDPSQLLSSIDIEEVSTKSGISPDHVLTGLESILPDVTSLISQSESEIANLLSTFMGSKSGELLSAAKKLFK